MPVTYKIGEAAALLNLKTYVLRFWETEFPQITPLRTEKGQRLYTEDHLALLDRIRFLLHERGLTIEGTRKVLAEEASRGVRYVRSHALDENTAHAAGTPMEYEPSTGTAGASGSEGEAADSDDEYNEIFSPAETPALPGYGLASSPEPPAGAPVPSQQKTASGVAPQAQSSGLTSGADKRKDIPIGLGVGFETAGGKRKKTPESASDSSSAAQTMTQGSLMQTRPGDAAAPPSLEDAEAEAGQSGLREGAAAAAPPPHNDWDAIKNAFAADQEDEDWDRIQNDGPSAGQPKAGKDARKTAMKDITDELESIAELLRGSTAGTSS